MVVDAVIEIPTGSQNKYEWDHKSGRIRLDRVLYSPFHYPADYGFVENTLALDGDPADIIVLITQPTFSGCVVRVRVLGVLEMRDDKGVDDKLFGVAADDPRYETVRDLTDVSPHVLKEIAHFFGQYKELEGKSSVIGEWKGAEAARSLLQESQSRYRVKAASEAIEGRPTSNL